jgi:hypothetical protein
MFDCEDILRDRFPIGRDAESERVHRKLTAMLRGSESFCYDFDDFNAQHSTESMMTVLMAYRDTFQGNMSPEQLVAMNWVIASICDVRVKEQNVDKWYTAKGTLMSGWRLTTFMNTVLNYVYM